MESSSRPKRSSRNQKPTYTFNSEDDFVDTKLTEERKNYLLELLKRDLGRPTKAASVGSEKHLEKLGREFGIPAKDLRKLMGITDDLTHVTGSSLSSKKKVTVSSMSSSKKDIVEKLDEEVGSLQRQLNDFEEKFKGGDLPSEEALMELEEEIQQATEQVEAVKLLPIKGKGTSLEDEERPVLVQSKPLDSGDEDDPMEMDLSMGEAPDVEDPLYFDWCQENVEKMQRFFKLWDKKSKWSKVSSEDNQSVGGFKSELDGNDDRSDEAVEEMQESPLQDEEKTDELVEMKGSGGSETEEE